MENNSASPISPTWPTHWPRLAFNTPRTFGLIGIAIAAAVIGAVLGTLALRLYDPFALEHISTMQQAPTAPGTIDTLIFQLGLEIPVVIALLMLLPWATGMSLKQLGFVTPRLRDIGIAIAGTIGAMLAADLTSSLIQLVTHSPHTQDVIKLFLLLRGHKEIIVFALFATIVAPIAEETIFRLTFFNLGLRYFGFLLAAIGSALLFGLAHSDLYNALPLACVGFIFAGVYFYTRNAYASMISHSLLNAISTAVLIINPHAANF